MWKYVVFISLFLLLWSSYWLTPKEDKWVITIESDTLEWESPEWLVPISLEAAPDTLDYWKSILPYENHKNEEWYIVIPTLWIISPVVFVPKWSQDYEDMTSGKEIDINKYLPRWVMHYPATWLPGEVANITIFWHSNFFLDREGDFNSIFADLMSLDVWVTDEIRFFHDVVENEQLFKYKIVESYETDPTDVWVLRPRWWKEITVFTPTNWLKWRWIIKWKMIEDNEILVPYVLKEYMWRITQELKNDPERQAKIISYMKRIKKI